MEGSSLPYVNIYLENSYTGTTSNDEGNFELSFSKTGEYSIVFQFLGYKKVVKKLSITSFPYVLNVSMEEELVSLDQVVISNEGEDPAYRIVRETVRQRKKNLARISEYTADFYSRGLWKLKELPKKIMGRDLGDFGGDLDSTRSGIIYLSETISKISYREPSDFKEWILASKVSGNDNGFSFNSAQESTFSFYENTLSFGAEIVSPIGISAMNYYDYKLEGVFYEGSKLINKIRVSPKRPVDRVWTGYVYIVEDDWQLYGIELTTTGQSIQIPFISELVFKQNFKFDTNNNFWVKISQTIDFGFGFFGLNGNGRFLANYNNYNFNPNFSKKSFTNEVLAFEPEANKKDSLYWKDSRPVPLTDEELSDYLKRDSLQLIKKSKPYLDSLDRKSNKLGILDPLLGYTFTNSSKQYELKYAGPAAKNNFNTLQGWNTSAGLSFYKWLDENKTNWIRAGLEVNYGFADDRLRPIGRISRKFNMKNNLRFDLSGGVKVQQFNREEPISEFINDFSTLLFERNYLKAYDLSFAQLKYSQEVVNGLKLNARLGYEQRKPLFNETDQVFIPAKGISYTSNNPLNPDDFGTAAIDSHKIYKVKLTANIRFKQKYFSNPNMKINRDNNKYPKLALSIENGFGASNSNYNYTQLQASINQEVAMSNKGVFYYNLKAGTFFNADNISFADFRHFNGNQTRVGTSGKYTSVFNLLPYYQLSTNKSYAEGHFEHDFKGFILGKIPGINRLNFNLIGGFHFLSTQTNTPYTEWSIGIDNLGIGKYRLLRLDYVRSYFEGNSVGAIIFGLKFLDLLSPR